jgi:hypothetical protein
MNYEGIFFGRGERLKTGLALLTALALVAGLAAVTAEAGSGGPSASTAKKKCKKAKKGSAAKKKKCKKKKAATPAPVVRATLAWTGGDADDADLDLFVFAPDGKVAQPGSNAIPQTSISGDATGRSGTETFTDTDPKPARAFSFGVCYQVGGSAHSPFTIIYVTADGVSHTESRDPGSSFHYDFPGGAPIPTGYCPN